MVISRGLHPCMALMRVLGVLTGSRIFSLSAWLLCNICGWMGYDV